MDNSNSISQFAEKLIEEKNFSKLDQQVLKQLKQDLLERVEERINATILENMPTEKLEEFNQLLDSAADETIRKYCLKNIPELDEKIARSLLDFRDAYLHG